MEFVEDAPYYAIPQLGDALHDVLNREAERRKTGILDLDLDPVVKQSNADGRSLLGVVRMDDRVHERLADRNEWNRPAVFPADALDD
jgi:hypothetical protein